MATGVAVALSLSISNPVTSVVGVADSTLLQLSAWIANTTVAMPTTALRVQEINICNRNIGGSIFAASLLLRHHESKCKILSLTNYHGKGWKDDKAVDRNRYGLARFGLRVRFERG